MDTYSAAYEQQMRKLNGTANHPIYKPFNQLTESEVKLIFLDVYEYWDYLRKGLFANSAPEIVQCRTEDLFKRKLKEILFANDLKPEPTFGSRLAELCSPSRVSQEELEEIRHAALARIRQGFSSAQYSFYQLINDLIEDFLPRATFQSTEETILRLKNMNNPIPSPLPSETNKRSCAKQIAENWLIYCNDFLVTLGQIPPVSKHIATPELLFEENMQDVSDGAPPTHTQPTETDEELPIVDGTDTQRHLWRLSEGNYKYLYYFYKNPNLLNTEHFKEKYKLGRQSFKTFRDYLNNRSTCPIGIEQMHGTSYRLIKKKDYKRL